MVKALRLLIVAEHPLLCDCLRAALSRDGALGRVESAEGPEAAVRKLQLLRPHVVLVEADLPGNAAVRLIREISDRSRVVVFGVAASEEAAIEWVEAGAKGYALKEESLEDLNGIIARVAEGATVCPPNVTHALFARLAELAHERSRMERVESMHLTRREIEILQMVADGSNTKDIAEGLCLSLHTVKNHVHNILQKLQVGSRVEAVEFAHKRHWLKKRLPGNRWRLDG